MILLKSDQVISSCATSCRSACRPRSAADTLALATGTHVGASDHAIDLFCILYGRVLGFLYGDTLQYILWFNCAHYYMFYICGCEAHFGINSLLLNSGLPSGVSVSVLES